MPAGGLDLLIRDLTVEDRRLLANRLNGKFHDGVLIFAAFYNISLIYISRMLNFLKIPNGLWECWRIGGGVVKGVTTF